MLVFLAELGDRTQFTTIFLATAPAFTFPGLLAGAHRQPDDQGFSWEQG